MRFCCNIGAGKIMHDGKLYHYVKDGKSLCTGPTQIAVFSAAVKIIAKEGD